MTYYTSVRLVSSKLRKVIVDETGKIVNRNPSKDELKGLKKEPRVPYDTTNGGAPSYTDKELLDYLIQFYERYGRPPGVKDFANNFEYPGFNVYYRRFGGFQKALKLVGLDVDSMVKKGIFETCQQKARLAEIKVRDHFKKNPIDLAGGNQNSPCDGICPNGKTYDVKSSGPHMGEYYQFSTRNKYKEEIEIYYLLAFNKDYAKLKYAWRIPGEIVEKDYFVIGMSKAKFNVENMKEYEITDKIKRII